MPGYYEHEELEAEVDVEQTENPSSAQEGDDSKDFTSTSRPPVSAPASSSFAGNSAGTESKPQAGPSSSRATSPPPLATTSSTKPSSSSNRAKRKRAPSIGQQEDHAMDIDGVRIHTCPICSKTLETDNRGLNEHVDFCLSKSAIREAQVMSHNTKSLKQPLPIRGKPDVKMKRAKK